MLRAPITVRGASRGFASDRKGGISSGSGYGDSSGSLYDPRINADMLYSHVEALDDEDEQSLAAPSRRKKPLMPMGIPRVEHKEEKIAMATAAEIEAREHGDTLEEEEEEEEEGSEESDGNMFVDDPAGQLNRPDPVKDEDVWEHAAPKPHGPVKIKRPDGSITETMDIDEIASGEIINSQEDKTDGSGAASAGPARKGRKRAVLPKDPEEEELAERLERNLLIFGPQDEELQAKGEPHPEKARCSSSSSRPYYRH